MHQILNEIQLIIHKLSSDALFRQYRNVTNLELIIVINQLLFFACDTTLKFDTYCRSDILLRLLDKRISLCTFTDVRYL